MLGLNTITLISSRVGSFIKRIITDGLKMRLPFTSAVNLDLNLFENGDFSNYEDSPYPDISGVIFSNWDKDGAPNTSYEYTLEPIEGGYRQTITTAASTGYSYRTRLRQDISHKLKIGRRYTFSCKFRSSEPVSISRLIAEQDSSNPQLTSNTQTTQSNQQYSTLTETFVCDANTEQYIMFWMNTYSTDIWLEVIDVSLKEHDQVVEDTSNNFNRAVLKTGKCLNLDGGNDKIDLPSVSNIKTLAFWIKPDSVSDQAVFYFGWSSGHRQVFLNNSEVDLQSVSGTVYVNNVQTTSISADVWSRVVIVLDSQLTTTSFDVGHAYYQKYGDFCISDLQVYDVAWSTDDINYDYKNHQNLVTDNLSSNIHLRNLKGWWHLSEGSGTVIHDSAPLVGGEEVVNRDFSTDSDWEKYGVTISNGKANFIGDGSSFTNINQDGVFTNGVVYKVVVDITIVTGQAKFQQWGINESIGWVNQTGVHTFYYTASGSTGFNIGRRHDGQAFEFYVNSVSVKEVFNVDGEAKDGSALGASWEDGELRIPQLGLMNWSKGSNLLEHSEDFNQWTRYGSPTIEQNIVAPDGTLNGTKLTRGSNPTPLRISNITTLNEEYTFSVYAKKGNKSVLRLDIGDEAFVDFTLTDEWQRFTITSTPTTHTHVDISFGYPSASGDHIHIWGAQLDEGSSATDYRRTEGSSVTNSTLIKTPDVEQFTGNKVDRNLIRYSEDLNHPLGDNGWNRHDCTAEYGYEDPFGSNRASKITSADLDGNFDNDPWIIAGHVSDSSNTEYTSSVWIKGTSSTIGEEARLWLIRGGTEYLSENFTITGDWERISITKTFSQSPKGQNIQFRLDPPNNSTLGDEVFVFGPQLQEGGLTRYFPTYGAIAQETLPIIGKDILGNDVESRGGALNLDGTGFAELMSDNVFDIPAVSATEGDFSICGWAKWNYVQQPNLSTMNTIFSNGRTLGTSDTFSVNTRFDGSTNKVRAYVNGSHINSTTTYSVGEWFYFALTRKKNAYTNNITLYVSKIDSNGDWVVTSEDVGTNNNGCTNSNDKTIGWDRQANDRKYHDLIDDIKFYNREQSLTEIQQNFNATKSAHTN